MARTRLALWPMAQVLILLIATGALAQDNLALNRPFLATGDLLAGWSGLVDGVYDSDSAPGCFATGNANQFPKSVTIDLQRPCNINRVTVHNSANGNTRAIIIYCSDDGQHYEQLREFIFPDGEALVLNHRFGDRPAQFVRIEFSNTWGGGLGGDNTVFCREVEVFGTPTGADPVAAPMAQPTGPPVLSTREARLFRRWALATDRPLSIAVLGDSFASCGEETWPQAVADGLAAERPADAQVSLAAMTEDGVEPAADLGYVGLTVEAQPDVIFVTFGSDLQQWDGGGFRSGLTELLRRLLSDTDALVVLVGPAVSEVEHVATGRRALAEMETLSGLLSLPLVRTEAALLREGVSAEEIADEDGSISERARGVITDAVLELLLHSQI